MSTPVLATELPRRGRMTREQFVALDPRPTCRYCGSDNLEASPYKPPHWYRVDCLTCGRCLRWLSKPKNKDKKKPSRKYRRPGIGVRRLEIWEAFGERCAGCGIRRKRFELLGISGQIHHVRPFAVVGHDTIFIPLCERCHVAVTKVRKRTLKQLKAL